MPLTTTTLASRRSSMMHTTQKIRPRRCPTHQHGFSESPDPSHPTTRAAAAAGDAIEDDDDLAVASERVSIKCPLTLLPMKEPVTSQKCPHSFEKGVILDMINRSDITLEGSGRRGVKALKCPVCVVVCQVAITHRLLSKNREIALTANLLYL